MIEPRQRTIMVNVVLIDPAVPRRNTSDHFINDVFTSVRNFVFMYVVRSLMIHVRPENLFTYKSYVCLYVCLHGKAKIRIVSKTDLNSGLCMQANSGWTC